MNHEHRGAGHYVRYRGAFCVIGNFVPVIQKRTEIIGNLF